MSRIRCGVLERGEVFPPLDGAATLQSLLDEAEALDAMGYSRLWFAEHHAPGFSHSSPEVMIAAAAARTSRIRVGSAGVLMYFYSPFKVASLFRTLSTMHPARIDMGLAAGWSSQEAQQALAPGFDLEAAHRDRLYAEKVAAVLEYLSRPDGGRPHTRLQPCPTDGASPSTWLLGSSGGVGNMTLAAKHGTNFCYMLCFGQSDPDPSVIATYREQLVANGHESDAKATIAGRFICRETTRQAEAAADFDRTPFDLVGDAASCVARVEELLEEYDCDEFILMPACRDRQARREGYALMAEALGTT